MENNIEVSLLEAVAYLLVKHPDLAKPLREMADKVIEDGKKLKESADLEDVFSEKYENHSWGGDTVSGASSSLIYTENLRKKLPLLIDKFQIRKVFDAPCGDLNWMKEILKKMHSIEYIGADIVFDLINENKSRYQGDNISFIHIDITKDALPEADLMIFRDCLFHFSYESIEKFLRNFIRSDIAYLLTTTHYNETAFINRDIVDGGVRLIDLFCSPFNFPSPALFEIDDWIPGFPKSKMCLWSKDQIQAIL